MATLKTQPLAMSINTEGEATNPEPEWSNEDEYWTWEAEGYTEEENTSSGEDTDELRMAKKC